jgi:hypothetical protein
MDITSFIFGGVLAFAVLTTYKAGIKIKRSLRKR